MDNDLALLRLIQSDAARQPTHYQPGPYWRTKARIIEHEIERVGLSSFRRAGSLVGLSYVDIPLLDYRQTLNHGARRILRHVLGEVWPISMLWDAQVAWTASHAAEVLRLQCKVLQQSPRVADLLARYTIPESTAGECDRCVTIAGRTISLQYLCLLDELDHVARTVDLARVHTVAELGGGFGANMHLLLTNFPNIRKVVYVDMAPTLYVGTQYLRHHFGSAVVDYRATRGRAVIPVARDASLEILCIAPWQLDRVAAQLDLFWNAHSFVEMPHTVVAHYAERVRALSGPDMAIALLSYDHADRSTLPVERLPDYFPDRRFVAHTAPQLMNEVRSHVLYCSPASRRATAFAG